MVFSDLDGTLLDHDTYEWSAAAPSLDALRARNIPVVLISSKTLAELEQIRDAMGLTSPVVAENGAAVDVADGELGATWTPSPLSVSRAQIAQALAQMRQELGIRCRAFAELGVEGIVKATGLRPEQAALANTRQASEPLLWQDTEEALTAFMAAAESYGLRCVRGGRFVHLMGRTDKAEAMTRLVSAYAKTRGKPVRSIALGDSPNDLGMLRAADVAILIPGPGAASRGMAEALREHSHLIMAPTPGPAGWHAAIQSLLTDLDTEHQNVG